MASKPKSFLRNRETSPSSASDEDFELVVGVISPGIASRPVFSQNVPVERIEASPFQARRNFDGIDELAETIKAQGFTTRLRVRPHPLKEGYFQLTYGERRLRAARLANLKEVPCDVANYSDPEMMEIGLAENIQRQDLNPMEEARAFRSFMNFGSLTIRELANRIGKNKDYVAGRLRLLEAPEDVQKLVEQKPDAVTAARRIAQLNDPEERRLLIEALLMGKLSKEEIRTIVQAVRTGFDEDSGTSEDTNEKPVRLDVQHPPKPSERELNSRKIGRDLNLILATLARWQIAMPRLNDFERRRIVDAAKDIMFTVKQIQDSGD
ncbi:ParB/RepB/Spo0J family partition protein [Candidatus Chlorohelix sp.]|uniref:ParB/RepB/Spo0J family partition protein n=1 Tax=Candidatus Chlorohelix sp. TaxID=3139201 RepID=UPI0030388F53